MSPYISPHSSSLVISLTHQVFPNAVSSFTDLAIAAHSFLAQHPLTMGVFGGTSGTKPALSELIPRLFTVFVFGVLGGVTLMILG